jgi:hypothetical protein
MYVCGKRTIGKSVVTDVVGRRVGEVEEQRSNASRPVLDLRVLGLLQRLERDGDTDEGEQHQGRGEHVHVATLEAGDDERNDGGVDERPAGVGDVQARLGVRRCVAHHAEKLARVVADEGVAGQLGEEADEDGDEEAAAHTRGLDEAEPGLAGHLHLGADGLADLDDLGLDELGVGVALGVVLDEDGAGLLSLILRDEETGRLREEAKRATVSTVSSS